MTRRAALLLDALADGPLSRRHIFERTGYLMSNNAASELRRELRPGGGDVVCTQVGREYVYEIITAGVLSGAAGVVPTLPVGTPATANTSGPAQQTVEAGGQLTLVAA